MGNNRLSFKSSQAFGWPGNQAGTAAKSISLVTLLIVVLVALFNGCQSPTGVSQKETTAPSHDLSAEEILAAQGITSIHFAEYDSIIVNGESTGRFLLAQEVWIDTLRVKIIDAGSTVAVYDLKEGVAWDYENGQLTYMQLRDLKTAYNQLVQALLGSFIRQPATYLGTENLDGKTCEVFQDSTGLKEWIWLEYKLPIQRIAAGSTDISVWVESTVQRRDIQVNVPFPDSVFVPPAPM